MQENDIDRTQQVFSPLRMDADGRFSRKGKAPKKQKKDFLFFDRILVPVLFMFFLLSADFIVFAGSGNLQIFENSILPIRPVLICLAIIFVICSILTYLLQKIKFLLKFFGYWNIITLWFKGVVGGMRAYIIYVTDRCNGVNTVL